MGSLAACVLYVVGQLLLHLRSFATRTSPRHTKLCSHNWAYQTTYQRLTKIATTVLKKLHKRDAAKSTQDLLTLRTSPYNLRGLKHYRITKSEHDHLRAQIVEILGRNTLWNSIPDPVRRLDNYKSFRKQLN